MNNRSDRKSKAEAESRARDSVVARRGAQNSNGVMQCDKTCRSKV